MHFLSLVIQRIFCEDISRDGVNFKWRILHDFISDLTVLIFILVLGFESTYEFVGLTFFHREFVGKVKERRVTTRNIFTCILQLRHFFGYCSLAYSLISKTRIFTVEIEYNPPSSSAFMFYIFYDQISFAHRGNGENNAK